MTKPLALIYYTNLFPGSQLANRFHELGYRVQVVEPANLEQVPVVAEQEKPLVMVMEVSGEGGSCGIMAKVRGNPNTQHIPILAYAADPDKSLQSEAKTAGASVLASNKALLEQLPHLVDQILMVE